MYQQKIKELLLRLYGWLGSYLKGPAAKIKKFLKEPKHRGMVISLLLLFFYIAGLLAQFINNRHGWAPGKELRLPSVNPLKGLAMLFTPIGVQAIVGLFLFLTIAALLALMMREDRHGMKYDKERKFWYSDKGVYGTAGWMTDEEMESVFDLTPEDECGGLDEIIYGYKDGMVVSRKEDSMLNPHIAVMGTSGSMKSRTIGRGMAIAAARKGESMVIVDPKGELAASLKVYLETEYGYDCKILNTVDPFSSSRFDGLEGSRDNPRFVSNIVESVIANTGGGVGDPIFDAAEGNLLEALIFLQFDRGTGEFPTLKDAYYTLLEAPTIDDLTEKFDECPPGSRALMAYNLFRKASPNLQGNIVLGLGARLKVLQNEEVAELMSFPEMDILQLGKKKTAYFLVLSDQDNTLRFVAAMFFSILFMRLVQFADAQPDGKLPVPVTLIMDEFCSVVGTIHSFSQKMSNVRSRGFTICIIFQQLGQLMNRFPDNMWSEILGNADTILCLGCSSDPITAEFISNRSGEVTIYADTVMKQQNTFMPGMLQPNYRHSEGAGRRKLLTPDEVMRVPREQMLLMVTGQQILKLDKFDYTRNPESNKFKPISVKGLKNVEQPPSVSPDQARSMMESIRDSAPPEETLPDIGRNAANSQQRQEGPHEAVWPMSKPARKPPRGKKPQKEVVEYVDGNYQMTWESVRLDVPDSPKQAGDTPTPTDTPEV